MNNPKKFLAQGLVEFALTLPFLLLLVLGAIDFGRAFYMKVALENSAREGAYYMVYDPEAGKANSFSLTKDAVLLEGQNSGLAIQQGDVTVVCRAEGVLKSSCPKGSTVVVTATQRMDMLVLGYLYGPLDLVGEARMLIP